MTRHTADDLEALFRVARQQADTTSPSATPRTPRRPAGPRARWEFARAQWRARLQDLSAAQAAANRAFYELVEAGRHLPPPPPSEDRP